MTKPLKYLYYLLSAAMLIMLVISFFLDRFDYLMDHRALFTTLFLVWWILLYVLFIKRDKKAKP